MKIQSNFYIAVMVYESSSLSPGYQPLYEETFMIIKAASIEEATKKALDYAQKAHTTYTNDQGEEITWKFKHLVDVNTLLYNRFEDGSEFYSRHFYDYNAYARFELNLKGKPNSMSDENPKI
jgi:hypothetical protein